MWIKNVLSSLCSKNTNSEESKVLVHSGTHNDYNEMIKTLMTDEIDGLIYVVDNLSSGLLKKSLGSNSCRLVVLKVTPEYDNTIIVGNEILRYNTPTELQNVIRILMTKDLMIFDSCRYHKILNPYIVVYTYEGFDIGELKDIIVI